MFIFVTLTKPTRHSEGQKSSLLDPVFSNEGYVVEDLQNIAPMDKSDGIAWTYICNSVVIIHDSTKERLNFKKGDYS